MIGTIRRFGWIIVNDLRITYPPESRCGSTARPRGPRT